jgi:hypothetical protein
MSSLGDKQRSETFRLHLTLPIVSSTTPQVRIELNGVQVLDWTDMTQDKSTLDWIHAYTTAVDATVGNYEVIYRSTLSGVLRYSRDNYDITVNDADSLATDIAAVPTVEEIDTELSTEHGGGAWDGGLGSGARSIIFNIKNGSAENVSGVKVSVHNNADDETPIAGPVTTDVNGNTTTLLLDDTGGNNYNVRLSNPGVIIGETESVAVTGDATINLTVVAFSITPPGDAELCKLWLSANTLENTVVTDHEIHISTMGQLTKVDGEVVSDTEDTFTYDAGNDTYYYNALQGAVVTIECDALNISKEITVPALTTQDVYDLL